MGNPSLTGRKGWGPGTEALSSGKYDGSAASQKNDNFVRIAVVGGRNTRNFEAGRKSRAR